MAWPASADFSGLQQSPTSIAADLPSSLQQLQQQQQQLTPTSSSTTGPPRKRKKSEIQDDSPQEPQSLQKTHPVKRACNQCRQQKVRRASFFLRCVSAAEKESTRQGASQQECGDRQRHGIIVEGLKGCIMAWADTGPAAMQHPDRTRISTMPALRQAQPDMRHRPGLQEAREETETCRNGTRTRRLEG